MALLDDLKDPDLLVSRMGGQCSVRALLDGLTKAERELLQNLLDNPKVPSSRLSAKLGANGYRVAGQTLQRHRRGECRCGARG